MTGTSSDDGGSEVLKAAVQIPATAELRLVCEDHEWSRPATDEDIKALGYVHKDEVYRRWAHIAYELAGLNPDNDAVSMTRFLLHDYPTNHNWEPDQNDVETLKRMMTVLTEHADEWKASE